MPQLTDSAGLDHYHRLFGRRHEHRGAKVDHASLPVPIAYLRDHGLLLERARGEWVSIRCPAHKAGSEAHPSLRVSLVDGHFRCHACGAKGGDILALHRLISGMGFRDAVRDLGGQFHD